MKIRIPRIIQKLAPLWTRKLKKRTMSMVGKACTIKGVNLDISLWESCIVGETLNLIGCDWEEFRQKYVKTHKLVFDNSNAEIEFHKNCKVCYAYSSEFHGIITNYDPDAIRMLEKSLRKYAIHLKEKHKRIINKAMKN